VELVGRKVGGPVTSSSSQRLAFTLERHQGVVDRLNEAGKGPVRRFLAGAPQPMCFGADMSHWQGPINFARIAAAGFTFVDIKATEGTGYVDPNFRAYRAQAHAAGLIARMYHYAGSSTARRVYAWDAEAAWFAQTVGPLAAGEGADLDWEPAVPPADAPGWARAFLDRTAGLGCSPWIYMNSTTERNNNWTAAGIPARYGLWLALYDNDPDMDPVVHWPSLAAEQYWDKATVPGVPGPVDVDVFYGTRDQLLAYGKGGTTPGGDLSMADAQAILDFLQNNTGGDLRLINGKVDRVVSAVVAGDGAGPQNNFAWLYDQLAPRLDAQAAALASLAGLVAQGHGDLSKDDILATVDQAIRDATVSVDVNVNHPADTP
jgi:lysozyme